LLIKDYPKNQQIMAILKVVEILANSGKSLEDAK
jgi:hypothetical protein